MVEVRALFTAFFKTFKDTVSAFDFDSPVSRLALKTAIATPLAIWFAWLLAIENPFWAGISAFVVLQSSNGASIFRGYLRLGATFGGAIIGLIIANMLGNSPPLYLLTFGLCVMFGFYYSNKTTQPYLWILGIGTLAMVDITLYTDPYDVTNVAYYRSTEVVIGILSACLVSALVFPNKTTHTLKTTSKKMLKKLLEIQNLCLNLSVHDINDPAIFTLAREFSQILDSHHQLLAFSKQEQAFGIKKLSLLAAFEEACFIAQKILIDNIERHHTDLCLFKIACQNELNQLTIAVRTFMQQCLASIDEPNQDFSATLNAWQIALEKLFDTTTNASLSHLNIENNRGWHQFLMSQQLLFKAFQNAVTQSNSQPHSLPWRIRLNNLFSFDRFYFIHSLKGALLVLIMPLLGVSFNIPGASQIGVSIIAILQIDPHQSRQRGFLRAKGCLFGALFTLLLLAMSIQNVWLFLALFGVIIYIFSYFHHGKNSLSYFGTQAGVAFIMGAVVGLCPVTTPAPTIERLAGIVLGVFAAVLFMEVLFPAKKQDWTKHLNLQLERYIHIISFGLQKWMLQPQHIAPIFMFHDSYQGIRKNILLLEIESQEEGQGKLHELYLTWRRKYYVLFNLMLSLQSLDSIYEKDVKIYLSQCVMNVLHSLDSLLELGKLEVQFKQALNTFPKNLSCSSQIIYSHVLSLLKDLIHHRYDILRLIQENK